MTDGHGESSVEERVGQAPLPDFPRAGRRGLTVRTMTPDDLAFLTLLYASTRQEELAPLPWSDEQKAGFLDMQFQAQHRHYLQHYQDALWLVIERAGRPVGRLYIDYWPSEHRIIDIALLPEARGQGLGGEVLLDVMEEADRQAKAVSIHVEKNNPAMRLYLRLGFVVRQDKGVYDLMEWRSPQVNTAS